MIKGVTVGVLVCNEEHSIEAAIRSAVYQCERLIISDNASTDRTGEICLRLVKEFSGVEYYRQSENIGSDASGRFLFSQVNTPYFMFLGGHDYIDPAYVKTLRELLDNNPDSVIVAGRNVPFFRNGSLCEARAPVRENLLGSSEAFIRVEFIANDNLKRHGCFIAYGLQRTAAFRSCVAERFPAFGGDLIFLAREALLGRILISPDAHYHSEERENDSEGAYLERLLAKKLDWKERRAERIKFAQQMYSIARKAAGGNPLYRLRLFRTRVILSFKYGEFEVDGCFDPLVRKATQIIGRLFRKQLLEPGNETFLENALLELKCKRVFENKKVAIFGAGLHTRRILATGIIPPESFVAIFDDSPKTETMSGIRVLTPESVRDVHVDVLLISSDTVEEKLFLRAKEWIPRETTILRIYS